jgi:hypothetical protein
MLNEIIRLPGAFQEGRAAGRVSGGAGTLLSAAQHSLAGSTTAAVLPTVPMGHVTMCHGWLPVLSRKLAGVAECSELSVVIITKVPGQMVR